MASGLMRKLKWLLGSKGPAASASMAPPSDFYAQEMESVLREQSFGIRNFKITGASPLQCTALVTLLEGNTIQVTLKNSGYYIENGEREITPQTHECIENLLVSASPSFEQKRQEALLKALERLS